MCGLGGLARLDGRNLDASADGILEAMARTLAHRGPDDKELLRDGAVGMAFTRLSLVDPEGGGQPLISDDGSVVLIANGEVYNHRELAGTLAAGTVLRTKSDCEVLVHLYQQRGLSFLEDVRGMFGLILWDRQRNHLLLARDHFGVKPLYYSRNRERLVFASEIKALFSDPQCPRQVAWDDALASPALTAAPVIDHARPTTWFEGVESVPAATILDIDLADGTTRTHTYWKLPSFKAGAAADVQALVHDFREILASSVSDCATADASIGLFLSGGVDSAAVAALASQTVQLETFTVLSGSTMANGDAEHAHRIAEKLGIPNHQVEFHGSLVPTVDEWQHLLWLTEMPTCGPEQYFKHELHRVVKAEFPHIKGMLLGAAADEYCGGYSVLTAAGGGWQGFEASLAEMARGGATQRRPGLSAWWEGTESGLLTDSALERWGPVSDPYSAFVTAKMRDIQQYNCWHEDRTAAGSGIEARVPFLDRRLVELVSTIPVGLRERLLWDKAIIREAVGDLLPPEVAQRPKVPFFYGDGTRHTQLMFTRMLVQDGGALLEMALASPRGSEYLDADRMRETVRHLEKAPMSGYVERLLPLLNLCLLDVMTTELPPPPSESAARLPEIRPRVPVTDWDSEQEGLSRRVLTAPAWSERSVLRLADEVTLLRSSTDDTTWYLAVNGSLEYVLDDDSQEWLAFLRNLDGVHAVDEVCAIAGLSVGPLGALLDESVDLGLLETVETDSSLCKR
ncbi:asparagine synthase (glutamine-hydrolyzing) [Actinacidiphila glaucinigra]|uniref:asparagine synthase (glutamine-hydrolyzing) n=1 Tax=Actinacidiphila glaucinigra TaxID=235986 RepID=UPI0037CA42C2